MTRKAAGLVLLAVLACLLPHQLNIYWIHVADVAVIYGILALGLALTMGAAGQVNLAQVAFFGVGAYASAILTTHGWPFWVAAIVALLAAALVGLLVSIPALRVQSHYLGIVTLGLSLAFTNLVTNTALTGQADGLNSLVVPPLFGLNLSSDLVYYYVEIVALALCLAWAAFVVHTRLGRRFRAMRDDPLAAASIGAEIPYLRITAFVLGAVFGGVAGVLYAGLIRYVSPASFSLSSMFFVLAGFIIGGRFSLLGAVGGAVFLVLLREELSNYEAYAQILYGGLVVVIVVFAPTGLVGIVRSVAKAFKRRTERFSEGRAQVSDEASPTGLSARPYRAVRLSDGGSLAGVADSSAALLIEHVTKRFRGLTALEDVDLLVPAGQIRGIVGPNGSGKTTLFNIISGIYTPTTGMTEVFGFRTTRATSYRLARRGVARTFQNLRLFGRLTVRDNVLVALDQSRTIWAWRYLLWPFGVLRADSVMRQEADALLALYGLLEVADSLPGVLSYGTQRRVEIARAMARRPRILLLDEPAAGLNGQEMHQLAEIVRDVRASGVTVVLIEHNMGLVMSLCDQVTVLASGRVIADNVPEVVAYDEAVIAAYLGESSGDNGPRPAQVNT
ncbi:MAG TPA: branched-chain amino acid ABC transporter ATP-binding protein/permease [Acidothermaceae bacterium]